MLLFNNRWKLGLDILFQLMTGMLGLSKLLILKLTKEMSNSKMALKEKTVVFFRVE